MDTEQNPIHSGFGETTTTEEVIAGRDLTKKVVVVTGGHSGIGLETTRVLSESSSGSQLPLTSESYIGTVGHSALDRMV
jgi:hypothetical protein